MREHGDGVAKHAAESRSLGRWVVMFTTGLVTDRCDHQLPEWRADLVCDCERVTLTLTCRS